MACLSQLSCQLRRNAAEIIERLLAEYLSLHLRRAGGPNGGALHQQVDLALEGYQVVASRVDLDMRPRIVLSSAASR